MLIEFIGCPCSGKTTTAAGIFSMLKAEGTPSEFISEQARLYIAEKRCDDNMGPHDPLTLTDWDQSQIMQRQFLIERTMKAACGSEVIIVSDSSPLSALLYVTPDHRDDLLENSRLVRDTVKQVDMIFYAHPVTRLSAFDPNRVHTLEQSLVIHDAIPPLLQRLGIEAIQLSGDAPERLALAMRELCARRG